MSNLDGVHLSVRSSLPEIQSTWLYCVQRNISARVCRSTRKPGKAATSRWVHTGPGKTWTSLKLSALVEKKMMFSDF